MSSDVLFIQSGQFCVNKVFLFFFFQTFLYEESLYRQIFQSAVTHTALLSDQSESGEAGIESYRRGLTLMR